MRKGILPIFIALIVVGSLGLAGSGYAGARYHQSVKLQQEADQLFNDGRYTEAINHYEKSLSRWKKDQVLKKLEETNKEKGLLVIFETAQQALYASNWQGCVDKLNNFDPTSKSYSKAQELLAECKKWLEQATKRKAEEEVVTKKIASATESTAKTKIPAPSLAPITAPVPAATSSTETSTPTNQEPISTVNQESTPENITTPNTNSSSLENTSSSAESNTPTCQSNTNPTFTNHITDVSKISSVVIPPRFMGTDLKTHSYLNTDHQRVPVYAPSAVTMNRGVYLQHSNGDLDYGFDLDVSCEVMIRFGHITDPVQSIKDAFGPTPQTNSQSKTVTPVSFAAGDLLGYTTGTTAAGNWDFGAYNSTTKNRYADDSKYNHSTIYTTAVCPYDFFSATLKSEYTSRYIQDFGVSTYDGVFFCQ